MVFGFPNSKREIGKVCLLFLDVDWPFVLLGIVEAEVDIDDVVGAVAFVCQAYKLIILKETL